MMPSWNTTLSSSTGRNPVEEERACSMTAVVAVFVAPAFHRIGRTCSVTTDPDAVVLQADGHGIWR